MKRILSLLLAVALACPALAADKPLIMQAGQIKALPAGTDLQLQNAIILPHITAPSSPVNGECWTTTAGLYCRISGATVGPYAVQSGTVTSVQASGGATGLSFSGGPITGSGTLALSGTLAVANGGTGSTSASSARSALGLGDVATQGYNEGTWTPTVSPGSGAITSYTASGHYTKIGRQIHCTASINITNNGTGAGYLAISLPFTSASGPSWVGVGREAAVTGSILQAVINSAASSMAVVNASNAYPGGTGYQVIVSISYFD